MSDPLFDNQHEASPLTSGHFYESAINNNNMESSNTNRSNDTTLNGPPPLPARPFHNSVSRPWGSSMNYGYNNLNRFGAFGMPGGYGGYGGYGSYGGYGGYGGYPSNMVGNDFLRIAEETCGQSFQSLESVVQSVSSVAMMLESTYFAIHSSFRAVLGVAHHLSSLKDQLNQFTEQMPVVRIIISFIKKLLYYLGLISSNSLSDHENAWRQVSSGNIRLNSDGTFNPFLSGKDVPNRSSLPILIFFGLVLGAPWMIWSLIRRYNRSLSHVNTKWLTGEDEHYIGKALYAFTTNAQGELPLTVGQKIIIAPKDVQPRIGDWLLAAIDGKTGLVPANYVKIIEHKPSPGKTDQQKL